MLWNDEKVATKYDEFIELFQKIDSKDELKQKLKMLNPSNYIIAEYNKCVQYRLGFESNITYNDSGMIEEVAIFATITVDTPNSISMLKRWELKNLEINTEMLVFDFYRKLRKLMKKIVKGAKKDMYLVPKDTIIELNFKIGEKYKKGK